MTGSSTGKTVPVCIGLYGDHERWLREPGNARELGVPAKVIRQFGRFRPQQDRERFLMFVMQQSPLMRVRGHGSFVTFEYCARKDDMAMRAISRFAKRFLGPQTELNVVNLARIQRHIGRSRHDRG